MSNQNKEEWVSEDPSEERLKEILSSKVIAIDLETKDTGLMEKGPGWATNDGYVTGVAISTDTFKKYYPLNHAIDEQTGGGNLENKEQVIAWLKRVAESSNDKVFHNASYDVGWLRTGQNKAPEKEAKQRKDESLGHTHFLAKATFQCSKESRVL